MTDIADKLREAVTVLDEPFHREEVSNDILKAARKLDYLTEIKTEMIEMLIKVREKLKDENLYIVGMDELIEKAEGVKS